ncbi:MAG: DUF2298 domain-containing protein [Anaerolineaceae bacterium]|nr:DUF2298 domain-containing protein [Anaerolineaceae bacterium]
MIQALFWFLFSLLLGFLCIPVTRKVFSFLPAKGVFFAKPLGLLLWSFIFWWLVTLRVLNNDISGQLFALLLLGAANLWIARKDGLMAIWNEIKENQKTIVWAESIFLFAFVLMTFVRAYNPEIINTEKFMEMAFINAIKRSPSFPPMDPWLSGYSISYYYFGYLLAVMLMRVTGTATEIGYNLVASFWFALTALGAYGVVFSMLAKKKTRQNLPAIPDWVYPTALLAPLVLLVVSNWHGALDLMHSRGLFYSQGSTGAMVSSFWQKLELRDLTEAPASLSWYPSRGWGFWAASRTVVDHTLSGRAIEIIDEFPAFSFILADIHPHVLNMPFILLAIAMAFEALLGGWFKKAQGWLSALNLEPLHLIVGLVTLGGLSFINTWDFPFYLLLIACSIVYFTYLQCGWKGRIWQVFCLCFVMGVASIALYLPFFLSFSSQAGGIIPSFNFFTRTKYFWVMFGPLLLAIAAYLTFKFVKACNRRAVAYSSLIVVVLLLLGLVFTIGLGYLLLNSAALGKQMLGWIGAASAASALQQTILIRLKDPGTLLSVGLLAFLAVALLISRNLEKVERPETEMPSAKSDPEAFLVFIVLLGAVFALIPEFVFLRDQFVNRMNTIFKFYFQAWILWSLAASYGLIGLLRRAGVLKLYEKLVIGLLFLFSMAAIFFGLYRNDAIFMQFNAKLGTFGQSPLDFIILAIPCLFLLWFMAALASRNWARALSVIACLGLAAGMAYPIVQLWNKTNGFSGAGLPRLDGLKGVLQPDEIRSVNWLRQAPLGTLVEANNGGQYSTYNHASTFSGMPSLLGWVGHESQWRGGDAEMGTRYKDIEILYSTAEWDKAAEILARYNIRYIYLGPLEASTYKVSDKKFEQHLNLVFDSGSVKIYENPWASE